ncbi:MAG: glycosyltransferase [Patescibacteria group bacterium]|nr:glycosyltransferase [Patescibacteria group bacterium]
MIRVSVVITVKNDDEGVKRLLADFGKQTVKPDEIIVVMTGKGTYRTLKEFKGNVRIVLAEVECSRGRGRNIGIRMARNELIAVTDVGCRPHEDWVEKIILAINRQIVKSTNRQMAEKVGKVEKVERLEDQAIVVAGWYRAVAETGWQKAFLPYLVPRGFNKGRALKVQGQAFQTFLPASRSIAFTKKAWELVGGYPEEPVSGGEDLKFADNLCNHPGIKIIYSPKAMVDWPVPATLTEFIKDMVKHTRGNFEAGYWPHIVRNLSVVARWMVMVVWPWVIVIYLGLEIKRRIKVINNIKIITIILLVRVAADAAVVYGTAIGIIDGWVIKKLRLRASDG